ncbi:TPA: 3-carboxy-cis,cis-muconate cycloisomerase [Kluyvera ascorbata]|uniref:3-carboxy-cis,cis-muconate cycloisomerase n=1 Tax=Kluyvera ascorbata TaxID=51288 RepID=UPI0018A58C9C|nr:3-carboxy-cis,cis-muconate cycloisomerase [Kluyvera ascorbata]BBV66072.1 3-carboxy-cis,cis-muconate cycloisomerase [Klebsiella sp. STW0522-44]MDU3910188.1 3-carboxy-cis,cis-muconate cycloisomerase [Kluyvera ascorbata]HAT7513299.1 3-carboxy-cis,cis-muconate cycloisomerase [Kluyvera ascorbata]HCL5621107.1 3-carboxy-cis,cis-muconate cycloisomerase [Kluyvera ascorbata]HDG1661543.1 3-carboxy-cis,cis-muconate cycloisomerase [Kluyvera ascorbata]
MSLLTPLLRTDALTAVFSDEQLVQGMLDFEAALAKAQARCGIIPHEAVEPIVAACQAQRLDFPALAAAAANAGNLAIPLVKQLTQVVKASAPEAARYVHWGATSQDAIDTGLMLQLQQALQQTESRLQRLMHVLAKQVARYQHTLMAGRTWMQHALPITYGLKLAGTLDALLRWHERLQQMRPRVLTLQFGGAAGTLASLKEKGPQVAQALADELNLALPDTPWHSQRDRIIELASWYAGLCATLGKFANDFALMMQTEVAEVSEPIAEGRGGSSAMPHKRNPVSCAAILAAVARTPGLMATLYASQIQQHERALGGWQAEWETLPQLVMLAGGVLENSEYLLSGMQVNAQKMRDNLDITHGLIMAESVTQALAAHIGKADAHHLIEKICHRAIALDCPLRPLLEKDSLVSQHLSSEQLTQLLDPANAVGSADHFVRQVLARFQELGT